MQCQQNGVIFYFFVQRRSAGSTTAMPLSTCELFLSLISALQVEILIDWLAAKDVGKLDSAFVARGIRESFLKILEEEHCVFKHTFRGFRGGYFPWMIKRRIKVSNAKLPHSFDNVQQTQFFQTTGKYLRKLDAWQSTNTKDVKIITNIVSELSTLCNNLEELIFAGCDLLKANICSVLQHFPRLRYLNLTHCHSNISGEMIFCINENARNLQTLMLSKCRIDAEAAIQSFSTNHTIHTLEVLGVIQLDNLFPFIHNCKGLRVLYVGYINLYDLLRVLKECPKLHTLAASVTDGQPSDTSNAAFDNLIANIQGLKVLQLHLTYENNLSDDKLHRLVRNCPNLRMFITGRVQKLYGVEFNLDYYESNVNLDIRPHIGVELNEAKKKHQLQMLVVGSISISTLQSIVSCCPQLTSIWTTCPADANGAIDRTLWGTFIATMSALSLKSLRIESCADLSPADLLPLRNLTYLSLTDTELQHIDVVELISRNPLLKKLYLLSCKYLKHDTLLYIVDKCVHLEELEFGSQETPANYTSENMDIVSNFIKLHRPKLKKMVTTNV